jgi:hypothetical protein
LPRVAAVAEKAMQYVLCRVRRNAAKLIKNQGGGPCHSFGPVVVAASPTAPGVKPSNPLQQPWGRGRHHPRSSSPIARSQLLLNFRQAAWARAAHLRD